MEKADSDSNKHYQRLHFVNYFLGKEKHTNRIAFILTLR